MITSLDALLDTGTTYILLPRSAYNLLVNYLQKNYCNLVGVCSTINIFNGNCLLDFEVFFFLFHLHLPPSLQKKKKKNLQFRCTPPYSKIESSPSPLCLLSSTFPLTTKYRKWRLFPIWHSNLTDYKWPLKPHHTSYTRKCAGKKGTVLAFYLGKWITLFWAILLCAGMFFFLRLFYFT